MPELTEQEKLNLLLDLLLFFGGILCVAGGIYLLFDDVKDFGKFNRIHHWHWGIILVVLGCSICAISAFRIICTINREFRQKVIAWLESQKKKPFLRAVLESLFSSPFSPQTQ